MSRFRTPTIVAIALSFTVCSILLISSLLSSSPQPDPPQLITVISDNEEQTIDLIYELKKAEIIPTVLNEFNPTLQIQVQWETPDVKASYGNTLLVNQTQQRPKIQLISSSTSSDPQPQLTLAITDPDAPSRENPEWSQFCHWIVTSIPLTTNSSASTFPVEIDGQGMEDVVSYRPPGPPAKTGKHRYVFVAMAPLNGTTEKLGLVAPAERRRWGFGEERLGVREWMKEMGLGVVGANFIYEQSEEQ